MDGLLKGYEFFKQFNKILGFTGKGKLYDRLVREFRDIELEFLMSVLDSRYESDGTYTNYAGLLKSFCTEAAKLKIALLQVREDLTYEETRGEYLNQNLAEFLFTGSQFPASEFSDESFRNFLLSILKAYLGGSTKLNMEEALGIFSNLKITLRENIQRSIDDDTIYDIADQFKFLVEVEVAGSVDFESLQSDFNFILNLIKPAHTNQFVRFIFNEIFELNKGCEYVLDEFGEIIYDDQGWPLKYKLSPTSICERFKMEYFDYNYDDIRRVCEQDQGEQCIVKEDITNQPSIKPVYGQDYNPKTYHARFGPFTDGTGEGLVTYDVSHVKVYVNGVEVIVDKIYP